MTKKGKVAGVQAALIAPRKFQCGNLVARSEPLANGSDDHCCHLYKVIEVPFGHDDASSAQDHIRCQWFEPIYDGADQFRLTKKGLGR